MTLHQMGKSLGISDLVWVRLENLTYVEAIICSGAFEPPPNQKSPGNFPFGVGSSRPTSNGKFLGNFPLDVKKKLRASRPTFNGKFPGDFPLDAIKHIRNETQE